MSIRAKERLYLLSGILYREKDAPVESALFCSVGDEIADANITTYRTYFETFGWIAQEAIKEELTMSIASVHLKHSDATGTIKINLPSRSLIQDVLVIPTEAAAGSPDLDFGEWGGDVDGLLDGLGQSGISDTLTARIDTSPDFKGRGALLTSIVNEDSKRTKVRPYYANGVTFSNTQNSAGTAGEWNIHIMYTILPEVNA